MVVRNAAIRIASLAVSIAFLFYVKFFSDDPATVSTNIMLTTLFFSILRSGFTFEVISSGHSASPSTLSLTIDKIIFLILMYFYSLHLAVPIQHVVQALFAASTLTLIFRTQYQHFTRGAFLSSVLISFVFPIQVTINLLLAYIDPAILFVAPLIIILLFLSYDGFFKASSKMGLAEVYYSMLLPIGGFSAISAEGIDKSFYLVVSKIVDSMASVGSFIIQGNLRASQSFITRYNAAYAIELLAALALVSGYVVLIFPHLHTYEIFAYVLLVNVCWFFYSAFTIVYLLKYGINTIRNIYVHFYLFSTTLAGLYILDLFEPKYIVASLSASFSLSMFLSKYLASSRTEKL